MPEQRRNINPKGTGAMKNPFWALLIGLLLTATVTGNQRINALWIGNSLTGQGICVAGYQQLQWYVDGCKDYCDTSIQTQSGYILASGDALAGATMLSQHWTNGDGLRANGNLSYVGGGERVQDPTGASAIRVDHYDYAVLQPWAMINDANIQKEKQAFGQYCDTMLALGVKPVIFGLYQEHDSTAASFAVYSHMYDSIYDLYKDQGALVAPVWRAYKKVWDVTGPEALFVPGDLYGHESKMGVYIIQCVFYATFTRHRSANIDWVLSKTQCPGLSDLDATHDFLEEKSDEAVSQYYPLEGNTTTSVAQIHQAVSTKQDLMVGAYDLTGRAISRPITSKNIGVYFVKNSRSASLKVNRVNER
jgi:hypothetical protein